MCQKSFLQQEQKEAINALVKGIKPNISNLDYMATVMKYTVGFKSLFVGDKQIYKKLGHGKVQKKNYLSKYLSYFRI